MNNVNDRFDYLISLAILDCAAEEVAEYESIDDSDVVIDESFDKRIYKLIGKKERETKLRKAKKISFRVAIAAMIVMSIMLLSMLAVSGIREAIWRAVVTWYDDYVAVSFVQEPIATAENPAEPTEAPATEAASESDTIEAGEQVPNSEAEVVPETPEPEQEDNVQTVVPPTEILEYRKPVVSDAYTEMELEKHEGYYMVDYYEGEEWKFIFWQNLYVNDEQYFDNIEANAKKIFIDTYEGVLILSEENEPNTLTWTDGEYLYTINGCLTENELIELAKTVR